MFVVFCILMAALIVYFWRKDRAYVAGRGRLSMRRLRKDIRRWQRGEQPLLGMIRRREDER